jgi:hypothetical protein
MICDALQELEVVYCMKLERIPLSLAPLENGQPSIGRIQVYPKEWWESVEWDQPNDKNILSPLYIILMCDMLSCNSQAVNQKIMAFTLISINSFSVGIPLVRVFPLMICVITFFLSNYYFL